jgi:hypothetical protein
MSNFAKVNRLVKSIKYVTTLSRCYGIDVVSHTKFNYSNSSQKYDEKLIKEDERMIENIIRHPYWIFNETKRNKNN